MTTRRNIEDMNKSVIVISLPWDLEIVKHIEMKNRKVAVRGIESQLYKNSIF